MFHTQPAARFKSGLFLKHGAAAESGGQVCLPAVGVVQVREEEHPAAEEAEQHEDAVDLMQHRGLLLVLTGHKRTGIRTGSEPWKETPGLLLQVPAHI